MDLEKALSELQCELVAYRNQVNLNQITWKQYDILELLQSKGTLLAAQIGEILDIPKSTISRNLQKLKNYGYVEQEQGIKDRRELSTSITVEGIRFLESLASQRKNLAQVVSGVLIAGEQATFSELSLKVAEALGQSRSGGKDV